MSALDLIKNGTAFQNPLANTLNEADFVLNGIADHVDVPDTQPLTDLEIGPLSLNFIDPETGLGYLQETADRTLFADNLRRLGEKYQELLQHTNDQTDPNSESDTPKVTDILSLNNGLNDDTCQAVSAAIGILQNSEDYIAEIMQFYNELQDIIADFSEEAIKGRVDQIVTNIEQAINDDIESFRQGMVELVQQAAAQVLESAFGDECAQKIFDQVGTQELEAQQKLYEESTKLTDQVQVDL